MPTQYQKYVGESNTLCFNFHSQISSIGHIFITRWGNWGLERLQVIYSLHSWSRAKLGFDGDLEKNASLGIVLQLWLFATKQHLSLVFKDIQSETQIPWILRCPWRKSLIHFPLKQRPEIAWVLCKGVLVKIGVAYQAAFPLPQKDEKPQVVIRKLNDFTDKLKVWEAAGETGQLQLQRKLHWTFQSLHFNYGGRGWGLGSSPQWVCIQH